MERSKRFTAYRLSSIVVAFTFASVIASCEAYSPLIPAIDGLGLHAKRTLLLQSDGCYLDTTIAPINPAAVWTNTDCTGTYQFNEVDSFPFSVSATQCSAACDTV